MAKRKVYWLSPLKDECQSCGKPFGKLMYDMKTQGGPWANLCDNCAMHNGGNHPGIGRLGLGLGQKYEKQPDGKWLKTEG